MKKRLLGSLVASTALVATFSLASAAPAQAACYHRGTLHEQSSIATRVSAVTGVNPPTPSCLAVQARAVRYNTSTQHLYIVYGATATYSYANNTVGVVAGGSAYRFKETSTWSTWIGV